MTLTLTPQETADLRSVLLFLEKRKNWEAQPNIPFNEAIVRLQGLADRLGA